MLYKSSSFHFSFSIRCFSPWSSWCTSAGLTAICQCRSWTSPKLDARLQMWPPICQTEGKDHFPASAGYLVGNNHPGCGWLAHYWLIFHLLSTGTLRSVSVKLLCSSIGILGLLHPGCEAATAFVELHTVLVDLISSLLRSSETFLSSVQTTPSNLVLPVNLLGVDTIPAEYGIVDGFLFRWVCHPPYSLYLTNFSIKIPQENKL